MSSSRSDTAVTTLLVWDNDGAPPAGPWTIVLWRGFVEPDSTDHSIPSHLEKRAEALRARFLAWLYDLGETQIGGKRLIDHFDLRAGLSFWWMTLLTEKSNAFNSPQLIGVLKLMAFEDLFGREGRGQVVLVSADKSLARAFGLWCRNARRAFEWRPVEIPPDRTSLARRLLYSLPHAVQALVGLLLHVKRRWPLRGAGIQQLRDSPARITLCSYLFSLDRNIANTGRLATSYWTELHSVLEREPGGANWLLLFIAHDFVPTARRGRQLIDRLNGDGKSTNVHAVLDGALGFRVVLGAVRDYVRVAWAALRVRRIRDRFGLAQSNLDLWPLFAQDWRNSFLGAAAMSNCLILNLFERTLRELPRQRLGVYLQENIGWEMAFIHCWKAAGHGQLVGVPHSTVRFWDLRYFFDPRLYQRTGNNDLPMPDLVALNGPAALDAFRRGDYPADRIVEVEALRYLYLDDAAAKASALRAPSTGPLRVLVLGDYTEAMTRHQMRWLVSAAAQLPRDTRYQVKAHPACPIDEADYPSLKMDLTNAPLDRLIGDCDVAYTGNMTSAAVDAYCAGVPVVSVLDGEAFNTSPLRGMTGVTYVTSYTELVRVLGAARQLGGTRSDGFFCLDRNLPRWRSLLGLQ